MPDTPKTYTRSELDEEVGLAKRLAERKASEQRSNLHQSYIAGVAILVFVLIMQHCHGKRATEEARRDGYSQGHWEARRACPVCQPCTAEEAKGPGPGTKPVKVNSRARIARAVEEVGRKTAALVVDDTGSTNDDRARLADIARQAVPDGGHRLIGTWLYADGQVRRFSPGKQVDYRHEGDVENTFAALRQAARLSPSVIILITDEAGDDWPQVASLVQALPPVVFNCIIDAEVLKEGEDGTCRRWGKYVAAQTGGRYIEHQ